MDRLACVDVPALALQLLLRRRPEWRSAPAGVVLEDKPQAAIEWCNERAKAMGIHPGMRYAAGLSLCADFRADVVSDQERARAMAELTACLRELSPEVEPSAELLGVLWVGVTGLCPLHPSLEHWAEEVRLALSLRGFRCRVVVGFSKFCSYAVARGPDETPLRVFASPAQERGAARRTGLLELGIATGQVLALGQLGIETLGDLQRLPAGGVLRRFGPELRRLQRLMKGGEWEPLRSAPPQLEARRQLELAAPSSDSRLLLFCLRPVLAELLQVLRERHEGLRALVLDFTLEEGSCSTELRPARPTLELGQLLELVSLRLDALALASAVEEIGLTARGVPLAVEQLELFAAAARRDLAAGERALARLRARYGPGCVVSPALREAHRPEQSFLWQPCTRLRGPSLEEAPWPRAVRRCYVPALPLSPRLDFPRRWLEHRRRRGSVRRVCGPWPLSGGWWEDAVAREYSFLLTDTGEWLWVYCDLREKRWYLAGKVS